MRSRSSFKKNRYIFFIVCLISNLKNPLIYAHASNFQVSNLGQIMALTDAVIYTPFYPAFPFEYEKLPLADDHFLHPYRGFFNETFMVTISHGTVFGRDGWVMINDQIIDELIWQRVYPSLEVWQKATKNHPVIKEGCVAVIAQSGYHYYYHWIVEVLGRLALLEMQGIEYDFLYVPTSAAYMKETLQLWGIDKSKFIESSDEYCVQATKLIVPSLVANVNVDGCPRLVHYIPYHIVHYVRQKLLQGVEQHKKSNQESTFAKKIFISRQDASARKIINEDEVFSLFETQGFARYHLTKLSVVEQILLFKNAEIIISALGSGLTNILFCNPDVRLIELYQARRDATIWNLSQMVGLRNHTCIKTTDFIDYYEGQYDTIIPLNIIEEIIVTLNQY